MDRGGGLSPAAAAGKMHTQDARGVEGCASWNATAIVGGVAVVKMYGWSVGVCILIWY